MWCASSTGHLHPAHRRKSTNTHPSNTWWATLPALPELRGLKAMVLLTTHRKTELGAGVGGMHHGHSPFKTPTPFC